MAFRYPHTSCNVRERVRMTDASRLSIDPPAAAAIARQAAGVEVHSVTDPAAKGENAFDGAVSALLAWAGSTDNAVASAVSTRGQAVASRAVAGLGELATMNNDNEKLLGAL
jgi:hypothetical protein